MSRIEPEEFVLKDGRKAVIREAEKRDAEGMLKIFDVIVANDEYNVTTLADVEKLNMTVEKEQEYIANHKKDGNIIIVAEVDGQLAGMVGIENGSRERISHVGTMYISVRGEYRRIGIATALLETLESWAQNDPFIEKIGLGVFTNNKRAIHLYEKLGFVEEGRRVKEIKISPGKYIDSILMYKFVK